MSLHVCTGALGGQRRVWSTSELEPRLRVVMTSDPPERATVLLAPEPRLFGLLQMIL